MIDPGQLRMYIVRPTLVAIGAWSKAAEDLVMGTAAQESRLTYLRQLGGGPALGFWQMEPATHDDIWNNYLSRKHDLATKVLGAAGFASRPWSEALVYNLRYAAGMCRVHYLRKPGAIPDTLEGQADYWKAHYNTYLGAGHPAQYVRSYHAVIGV
ncbi:MAG: hypothetical protein H3C57_00690 [Gammaproteobacteria bacterium]|nr:hypothetical protein [Gammaproteobacteria bacterium]